MFRITLGALKRSLGEAYLAPASRESPIYLNVKTRTDQLTPFTVTSLSFDQDTGLYFFSGVGEREGCSGWYNPRTGSSAVEIGVEPANVSTPTIDSSEGAGGSGGELSGGGKPDF